MNSRDLMFIPAVRAAIRAPASVSSPPAKPRTRRQPKFRDCIGFTAAGRFYAMIPMRTVGESNVRSSEKHWGCRKARVDDQHLLVGAAMRGCMIKPPAVVTMVRLAPRMLDDDGAVSSMKSVRDCIARFFGVDDRHADLVRYVVEQRPAAEPMVVVIVEGMA